MLGIIKAAHHTGLFSVFLVKNLGPNANMMTLSNCHPANRLWLWLWIADLCSLFLQKIRKGSSLQSTNAKCRCRCVVPRPVKIHVSILLDMARYHHNNALLPLVRPWPKQCGLIPANSVPLRHRP